MASIEIRKHPYLSLKILITVKSHYYLQFYFNSAIVITTQPLNLIVLNCGAKMDTHARNGRNHKTKQIQFYQALPVSKLMAL